MDAVLGLAEESVLDVANVVEGGLSAGARELMRMVISWRNAPPPESCATSYPDPRHTFVLASRVARRADVQIQQPRTIGHVFGTKLTGARKSKPPAPVGGGFRGWA